MDSAHTDLRKNGRECLMWGMDPQVMYGGTDIPQ